MFFFIFFNSFSQLYVSTLMHQSNSISSQDKYSNLDIGVDLEYEFKQNLISVEFWPLIRELGNINESTVLFQVPFMFNTSRGIVYNGGLPLYKPNVGVGIYFTVPVMAGLNNSVFYGGTFEVSFDLYFLNNTKGRIGIRTNIDSFGGLGRGESGVFMRFSMPTKDVWAKMKQAYFK